MKRDSERSACVRCAACGRETDPERNASADLSRVHQVVVACGACRRPFVVVSRN